MPGTARTTSTATTTPKGRIEHIALVSVLLSAHNSAEYLDEAVRSILEQSFDDFELIIVDDGSTDDTARVVSAFADPRITVITNAVNIGIPRSLNLGLTRAQGRYIARMDADDVSLPDRLERQVDLMESQPDVGVCGMWTIGFGTELARNFSPPSSDRDLRLELFFDNPIPHPTVMIRAGVLRDNNLEYDATFRGAEDYDLWARMAELSRFAVIAEPGLKYRFHASQATSGRMEDQTHFAGLARVRFAQLLVPDATSEQLEIHRRLTSRRPKEDAAWLKDAAAWVSRLVDANSVTGEYDDAEFRARLARLLFDNAVMIAPRTRNAWSALRKTPSVSDGAISAAEWIRFGVRCAAFYARPR